MSTTGGWVEAGFDEQDEKPTAMTAAARARTVYFMM